MSGLRFSIPITLPTINAMMRMHWRARRRLTAQVGWLVKAELVRQRWQAAPLKQCRITLHRYSAREPDIDALPSTAKLLLDVLQPVSARHPNGLGVIVDDARSCIASLHVHHIAQRRQRTDVEIEAVEPATQPEAA